MPQVTTSIQNNFTKGLITEATGLSFPENAAFDTDNTIYTLIGDVTRREGFNFETNFTTDTVDRTNKAISEYKWNNVGGDGLTQIVVRQIGSSLYFFLSSLATLAAPLSTTELTTIIPLVNFLPAGSGADPSVSECQYSDGNGYLFVYHPSLDPFYCTFLPGSPNTVTATAISVQVRDFNGVYPEPGTPSFSSRPSTLNAEHNYNLQNQGWTAQQLWGASEHTGAGGHNINVSGVSLFLNPGSYSFNVGTVSGAAAGQAVTLSVAGTLQYSNGGNVYGSGYNSNLISISGVVTAYSGGVMTINVTSGGTYFIVGGANGISAIFESTWSISESNVVNTINTFQGGVGVYPSNTDVWYLFKNTSNVFSPSTTFTNVALSNAPASRGHFILNAFNQNRTATSGITGLTSVSTFTRPRTGCWFQGRVWFSGCDASQTASGDQPYYTWTENIYFSQVITAQTEFGFCYQENDPTNEDFFDLLPTDGGTITIQGAGAIYKLFPVQNGLLVFAANGIWFITGSQGIGFSATDYTITPISGVRSISGTSFVNVFGFPVFWNEEGIYSAAPGKTGSIEVNNLALGTILTYYSQIPLQSKKFARGDFNPVDYIIQWTFKSTNETTITSRYEFDKILNFNTANKAFYPYSFTGTPKIHGVLYVAGPGGSASPTATFKYLTSFTFTSTFKFTFSEENDVTHYKDWFSFDAAGVNFTSYFVTGYALQGQAQRRWRPEYIYLFCRNQINNSYKIQGQWEFAIGANSGKWSTVQLINDTQDTSKFGVIYHRHKIRGHGLVFQMKVASVDGKPFDVIGWSMFDVQNTGP